MCCVPCPAQFPTAPTVTSHAERWTRAWGRAAPAHKTPPKPAPVRVLAAGPCRQRQGGREPWCAPAVLSADGSFGAGTEASPEQR